MERVRFEGSQGVELSARLERPAGIARGWALFAHCFTCSKDLRAARQISAALTQAGYGVLRFDFTGLGESEGEFADTNFSSSVGDLLAAVAFMRGLGHAPQVLVGHSFGGAAVLAAAAQVPEVVGVATIAAPFEPTRLRRLIEEQAPDLAARGEAEVVLGGRPFRVKQQLLEDLASQDQPARIASLEKALLILHAPLDQQVGIDDARKIFEVARHPKSFVALDGADHLLSDPRDARYAGQVIAAWAARYLPPESEPEPVEGGRVRVSLGEVGFACSVEVGRHRLTADEPTSVPGGTDTGPAPYDFLLTGLGACTAMTLRMYAERKRWPLSGVRVDLRHRKLHAKDCADCESDGGRIDELERAIALEGELDAEQRRRLLEIADRCPVHRTLEGEIKIRTREA